MYNRPLRKRVFGIFLARCRVLTCIRPLMRPSHAAGPYGVRRSGPNQSRVLDGTCCTTGFPDPVSRPFRQTSPRPLPLRRLAAFDDLHRRCRSLVNTTAGHQGPYDPRHLVCQCDPHQHSWLTADHVAQPCSVLCASMHIPFDDYAVGADDQQASQRSLTHLGSRPQALFAAR